MKIDDNVHLRLSILFDILAVAPLSDFILGHVFINAKPFRGKCENKFFIPIEEYSSESFPTYTAGGAYLMTYNASVKILNVCPTTESQLHLEDVLFTGICREKAGVPVKNDDRICQKELGTHCATEHRQMFSYQKKQSLLRQLENLEE